MYTTMTSVLRGAAYTRGGAGESAAGGGGSKGCGVAVNNVAKCSRARLMTAVDERLLCVLGR